MDKEVNFNDKKMININANLVDEVKTTTLNKDGQEVKVANFTLIKKYGSGKEYINCSVYGDKVDITKNFTKGDKIHIFGYFKKNKKNNKVYKNFIVISLNKIDKEGE